VTIGEGVLPGPAAWLAPAGGGARAAAAAGMGDGGRRSLSLERRQQAGPQTRPHP
jgi:hypothetical protein